FDRTPAQAVAARARRQVQLLELDHAVARRAPPDDADDLPAGLDQLEAAAARVVVLLDVDQVDVPCLGQRVQPVVTQRAIDQLHRDGAVAAGGSAEHDVHCDDCTFTIQATLDLGLHTPRRGPPRSGMRSRGWRVIDTLVDAPDSARMFIGHYALGLA